MTTTEIVQVSGKKPGELLLEDACECCFWHKRFDEKVQPRSPFPAIFGAIDRMSKAAVEAQIDELAEEPPWLSKLGPIGGYISPTPTWRTYQTMFADSIRLTGDPDGIFVRPNGRLVIPDLKCARFKGEGDPMFPIYRYQLTAYAVIAQALDLGTVDSLWLVYFEPGATMIEASKPENQHEHGFRLPFYAQAIEVKPIEERLFAETLVRACEIIASDEVPPPRPGCLYCWKRTKVAEAVLFGERPDLSDRP